MAHPIRIAYLVSQYPTVNHSFILREIVGLRALEFDIQVIAIRGGDRPAEKLMAEERREHDRMWTVLPFGGHFLKAHLGTFGRNPSAYLSGLVFAFHGGGGLKRILYFAEAVVAGHRAKQAGFSHIHSHFSSTVALIASRIFGFTLSISIHGPDEFRNPEGFRMREKVAHSTFIAAISHYARSQIMQASNAEDWPKIAICRLGVDLQVFAASHERPQSDEFNVICVGRLAGVKAQRVLIAACRRLVLSGSKVTLHLVGAGPDRASLETYAASLDMERHVVFEGSRNQAEVIALCAQSDVFALASFAEGVPVVLMEAMAMELPCVATWVNGIPELIRDGESGMLVPPSDDQAMSDAIERLLNDAELRRRLGRAGRQSVLHQYNLRENTKILAEVFQKYVS